MAAINEFDLRLLKVFATIAACGGFQRAQAELGVSASTISTYMTTLEQRLGMRLCQRGRVGFKLTEKGERVLAATQRVLASIDTFRLEVGEVRGPLKGTLRVGLIDNVVSNGAAPLPDAIARFVEQAPEVDLHLEIDQPRALECGLLEGTLHVAIGPFAQSVDGLSYVPLFTERHSLYCSADHPLFERCPNRIDRADLATARFVGRTYARGADMRRVGVARASAFVANVEAQLILILSGAYVGYLPDHYAAPFVAADRLGRIDVPRTAYGSGFSLAIRRGATLPRVVDAFQNHLFAVLVPGEPALHAGNSEASFAAAD